MRKTAAGRLLLCGLRAIIQVYRGVSIKEYYGKRKNQSVADLVPRGIYGGTDRLHYVYLSQLTGNGAQSSARSQAVMQLVNSALAKVHLGPLSEHLIRKLAHFSEFALEGFLLMLCIRVYTKHFVRHMSWPLLGGMTTALMDETIQLHSPNRTSSVVDVWIDMSGVVAGLLFALIILLIVRGVTAFIRVKQENRALRAESEELRRREHERLARRAAHRAHEAQLNRPEPDEDNYEEDEE